MQSKDIQSFSKEDYEKFQKECKKQKSPLIDQAEKLLQPVDDILEQLEPDYELMMKWLNEPTQGKNTIWKKKFDKWIQIKLTQLYPKGFQTKLMLYTKKVEYSGVFAIRAKYELPMDPQIFWAYQEEMVKEVTQNGDKLKTYMHIWKEAYVMKKISLNSDVAYKRMEGHFIFEDRDYVVYRHYIDNKKNPELVKKYNLPIKNQHYVTVYERSIKLKCFPERKGIVRAHSYIIGVIIYEDEDNNQQINIEFILHNDARGMIPKWLINWSSTTVCKMWIKGFMEGFQKFAISKNYSSQVQNLVKNY